jgi:hypothetical protein
MLALVIWCGARYFFVLISVRVGMDISCFRFTGWLSADSRDFRWLIGFKVRPIPPSTTSSNPGPQVDIGILQRLGFVKSGQMLGDQLGWSEAWIHEPARPSTSMCGICGSRSRTAGLSTVCLETIKGLFGRQEYRFVCPNTGRQSTAVSYSNGQFLLTLNIFAGRVAFAGR